MTRASTYGSTAAPDVQRTTQKDIIGKVQEALELDSQNDSEHAENIQPVAELASAMTKVIEQKKVKLPDDALTGIAKYDVTGLTPPSYFLG